ncbi:MAG TPA: Ni/Fe-hydrogenase cytochrome b subunit [Vicinamibacteria bacterium]|nr:Ni/Fe-hydrogenase cytochrome b subunit [Vicinamibacteria bacterium]
MRLPKLLRPFEPLLTPNRPDDRYRPGFWTYLFGVILAAGAVVTVLRFWKGLGAVTNLSDKFPWGLWIGFDVLCGVALAAGGFTITAAVYVFNLKRFKPIVRPTVLTAFLGYLLVAVGLMYDLGKPWNIWHPIVMWNPRSPMFEVGWCVILYLTVLSLEFSGAVFEKLGWKKATAVQHAATVPLVIAGVIISTLHQSSLGTFYLIVPQKLHALWYTPYLSWMFYFSAIAGGLAMIIVESRLSSRAFGKGIEMPLLQKVAEALVVALAFYATVRLADMARLGVIGEIFTGSREARFFQLEMALGVVLPLVLLSLPAVRRNSERLFRASVLVVAGLVVNRLNVSLTGLEGAMGGHYVPTIAEGIITLMLVGCGVATFTLAVRYLPIMEEVEEPELVPRSEAPAVAPATVPARS